MQGERRLRRRIFEALERTNPGMSIGFATDLALVTLIVASVIAVLIESIEHVHAAYSAEFAVFEAFCVVVFGIEYVVRVWASADRPDPPDAAQWRKRLSYVLSPMALVDLVAIVPFFLPVIASVDLRFLRLLRLLRVLKLARYSGAMRTLLEVLHNERRAFGAALSILITIVMFAASVIYLVEHEAQPEAFGSIPAAMWWSVAALTTVGYGDVTPITPLGKLVASAITIVGVGMVALPAGVLAAGFTSMRERNRRELEHHVGVALEDGVISDDERVSYAALANELGVVPEVAEQIARAARRNTPVVGQPGHCPHCSKSLTEV